MSKLKILIRSLLPNFIIDNYRQNKKAKINKASSSENNDYSYTEKAYNTYQKDFGYKDVVEADLANKIKNNLN